MYSISIYVIIFLGIFSGRYFFLTVKIVIKLSIHKLGKIHLYYCITFSDETPHPFSCGILI